MTNYTIRSSGRGFFEIVIANLQGASEIRKGFVSEQAAQRWVDKQRLLGSPFPPQRWTGPGGKLRRQDLI
jgi:hypothetical protein